jgi:hypothetical protein
VAVGSEWKAASRRALDDLDTPARLGRHPVEQRAGGGVIRPPVAQPRELGTDVGAHELRTVAVVPVSRMDDDLEP